MRVPLSWLLEYATVGPGADAAEVARRLTAAGLEVETVEQVGHEARGIVVAEVTAIEDLTGFRKPVRYCTVNTGTRELHVICGAVNFSVGDRVPLALPGSVLPGGVEIGARQAYGRMSEGMICSAAELGIGDDHSGILVLPSDAPPPAHLPFPLHAPSIGGDFADYAGLRDHVLDINVTPDKGFALSIRGVSRELAIAFGADFTDPADAGLPADVSQVSAEVYPASIEDPTACDRFVLREVHGVQVTRPTPLPIRVRLARAGIRSVSLAVDITNYLMLELGQPLHAFDRARLSGPIVVRRARAGERLETLDHVVRELDPEDILITDSSGPISMAGTMGGLATEITEDSCDLVIEAAHFSAPGTARMSRRHRLFSESSARFERGVDRELPLRASAKAASMLASLGGGTVQEGSTHAWVDVPPVSIMMAPDYPDQVAGMVYGRDTVVARLGQVGCEVSQDHGPEHAPEHAAPEHARHEHTGQPPPASPSPFIVRPPSWRPDLTDPADLAEEVIRLEGYENIPVRKPRATAGLGLTARQRMRRTIGRALAGAGYVEVLSTPFGSAADADRMGLRPDDPRRSAPRLVNPISEEEPLMRTTLLPGLLGVLTRNLGRGFADLALFELGLVFLSRPDGQPVAPILRVDRAPTAAELATLQAALPHQPLHLGVVLAGDRELSGWWGPGRAASFQDAIEAAREVIRVSRVPFRERAAQQEPWHPGRCAALFVDAGQGSEGGMEAEAEAGEGWALAGYAGELHPRVVQAFGLPPRTCAAELDLSVIESAAAARGPVQAPSVSGYPVATQDVALVVPDAVPAADVQAALAAGVASAGAGPLLEGVRLFDVYTGEQAGEGSKSLAYTLRFRAPDRTLTADEVSTARDAAVAEAGRRTGAVLRGGS
ncbi:MAG TPA: phenylalanine--tRNA ligase subunit beta [Streptosporangiaceae bacterium]|nr:phenylalanine--tRNA ligase subunit beta [Streptosporangiaceae bacterium]